MGAVVKQDMLQNAANRWSSAQRQALAVCS